MDLAFGLLIGIGMGALIQRVRASSPGMIARNLRLENLSIIKFMALAIAVGAVASYVLAGFVPMHFSIKPTYVLGVLAGGLVFGLGFGLAGYCPGTCVVGAAEGRKDALFTLAGGLGGALAFTLAFPALERSLITPFNYGKITLADLIHLPPLGIAVGLALILAAFAFLAPTQLRRPS
ncbi:MAG TPA: YeeE/YedE thiosulfate transporter family protein [Pantanalinema sp.]